MPPEIEVNNESFALEQVMMSFVHKSNKKFMDENAGVVNIEGRGKGI